MRKRLFALALLTLLLTTSFSFVSSSHPAHAAAQDGSNNLCGYTNDILDGSGLNSMDIWPCIDASSGNSVHLYGFASFRKIQPLLDYYSRLQGCTVTMTLMSNNVALKTVQQDCMGWAYNQSIGVTLSGFTVSTDDGTNVGSNDSNNTTLTPGAYSTDVTVTLTYIVPRTINPYFTTFNSQSPTVNIGNSARTCTEANNVSIVSTSGKPSSTMDLWPCIIIDSNAQITTHYIAASFRNIWQGSSSITLASCEVDITFSNWNLQKSDCTQYAKKQSIGVPVWNTSYYYGANWNGPQMLQARVIITYRQWSAYLYSYSAFITRNALYA